MTAPITSNRPTTTRLHHYAGRHSHGSGIPVETLFAPAWGASTPVETFFAHAHPKWLIFDHFHLAGAIFLSQRHPKLPPGATQGRSFFHTAPRDDTESPPVWRAPEGAAAVPVGGGGAWPSFEATRRAKLAARTARGRAAAHRHTQRPGPTAPGTPAMPHAPSARPPGYAKGAGTEVPAPHSATASSRLRPIDRQSWRRRRIHRNMPPTKTAIRPGGP